MKLNVPGEMLKKGGATTFVGKQDTQVKNQRKVKYRIRPQFGGPDLFEQSAKCMQPTLKMKSQR